ncbi:DUF177 domain-containing protein [Pseudactinotalea sp. HY160]|uniref:YceD family protein n=1 Tax=Pseudactinotalea sp. HY160 TaxID=2654490 RepID=UPI00351B8287
MTTSPFVIDTHDLGRRAGSMRTERRVVPSLAPLGTEVIGIPEGTPIEIDVRLEAVMEGVLVTGTATVTATGVCGRCLRPLTEEITVDVSELYAYPDRATHHGEVADEDEDPLPVLVGESLDLEGPLVDALVPALPFQPLCRPDCAGLCPECGVRLDEAEPGHAHAEPIDPRWAALTALSEPDEDREK